MLTATEGADRVAEGHLKGRRPTPGSEHLRVYTCENCGGHEFYVARFFTDEATAVESLPCQCPGGPDEAARREFLIRRNRTRFGPLGEDHRAALDEEGESETEREEVDLVIDCRKCFERARPDDWREAAQDDFEEVEDEDDYWEVRCNDCDHEIEFGWSHPERGGSGPCEASDFNPWRCVPELRFTDEWKRRGWLRPLT